MRELFIESDDFETRVALRNDNRLIQLEREAKQGSNTVGAIFHGKVRRVLPGMDCAFVEIGEDREAFLHADDVPGSRSQPLQELLTVGERLLVQVTRSINPQKGPRVTTEVTIPGRLLVLLPFGMGVSVSRRINAAEELAERLRPVLEPADSEGAGWIVRTAGANAPSDAFAHEAAELWRLWEKIRADYQRSKHPQRLHTEPGLAVRSLRDFAPERAMVQGPDAQVLRNWIASFAPQDRGNEIAVEERTDLPLLFADSGIDLEIKRLEKPWVALPSGGSLVIESTEALVSIDVNSGKDTGTRSFDQMALATNLEAADEIPRQVRLRGLGGLIVVDFIDLRRATDREQVVGRLHEAFRADPQRVAIGGMSKFGLVDLTRQQTRPSYFDLSRRTCPSCRGYGKVASLAAIRAEIRQHLSRHEADSTARLALSPETARRLGELGSLAAESGVVLEIIEAPELAPSELQWRTQ